MKRNLLWLSLIVLALSPAVASAQQQVSVDYDTTFDFSKIKTFSVQIATSWNDSISEQRVLVDIQAALTAKGWTSVAPGKGDATVLLHGATQDKKALNAFYAGGGPWGWGGGVGTVTTQEYTVGTLVVDIYDTSTKKLLYRGTASDEVGSTAKKDQEKMEKATNKLFYNFPPAPSKKKKY